MLVAVEVKGSNNSSRGERESTVLTSNWQSRQEGEGEEVLYYRVHSVVSGKESFVT